MLKSTITYLNLKLQSTGFFNTIYCLSEKIEKEGQGYPAIYTNNEYKRIELDPSGSICYWRKSSDVTISEEESLTTTCGIQYRTTVPLKLVGFIKKDIGYNDQYFSDNIIGELIGVLTTNNAVLKKNLKAKSVNISANKYVTDALAVSNEEYDNVNFEPKYTHAYFSIDFNLVLVTNQNCFIDICDMEPFVCGSGEPVSIIDQNGNLIESVSCGGEYEVLVFSGIDGGNSSTIYSNSIVAS